MEQCAASLLEEVMEEEVIEELVEETVVEWDDDGWDDDGWELDGHSSATTAPFAPDDTTTDCTQAMYSYQLTASSLLKYQVNVLWGSLSMELIHNGGLWLGLALVRLAAWLVARSSCE